MQNQNFMPLKRFLFATILLLSGCLTESLEEKCCACMEFEGTNDAYIFPVVPGTPEWSQLKTGQEKYEACQVPEQELSDMCPAGMVQTWLTYPMFFSITAWSHPQVGFEQMMLRFNLLEKMLKTHGSTAHLVKNYLRYDILQGEINSVQDTSFRVKLYVIEVTLAQNEILRQLDHLKKKKLIKKALENRALKNADDSYSLYHATDAYILASLMLLDDYAPFRQEVDNSDTLEFFVRTGTYLSEGSMATDRHIELNMLIEHAKNYLNEL